MTVSEAIEDLPEAGGLAYLGQLADNTPSVANIEAYAQIVRDRAHLRQLMSLGHHCTRTASNHQANPSEVQEEIEQSCSPSARTTTTPISSISTRASRRSSTPSITASTTT